MPNEQPQQTIIPPIVAQEVGLLHLQLVMATQEIARLNQIITERQAQNVVTNPDSFDAG
jgi:hypothetical protein